MYVIYVDGVEQKRYESKYLCHIWLIMNGYVKDGYGEFGDNRQYWFIDERVKIEVEI